MLTGCTYTAEVLLCAWHSADAPVEADWVHMIGVGCLRCSFNDEGQCEGLQTWDE